MPSRCAPSACRRGPSSARSRHPASRSASPPRPARSSWRWRHHHWYRSAWRAASSSTAASRPTARSSCWARWPSFSSRCSPRPRQRRSRSVGRAAPAGPTRAGRLARSHACHSPSPLRSERGWRFSTESRHRLGPGAAGAGRGGGRRARRRRRPHRSPRRRRQRRSSGQGRPNLGCRLPSDRQEAGDGPRPGHRRRREGRARGGQHRRPTGARLRGRADRKAARARGHRRPSAPGPQRGRTGAPSIRLGARR